MSNLFDRLSPVAAFAAQLFTNAGLDLAAMTAAGDPDALKTHLDQVGQAVPGEPSVAEAIEQATATLQADLTKANETISAQTAVVTRFNDALATAGITPKAADEKAGLQATDITAAIEAKVSLKAAELAAQQGTRAEVTTTPNAAQPGQAQPLDPKLTGLARAIAAHKADPKSQGRS